MQASRGKHDVLGGMILRVRKADGSVRKEYANGDPFVPTHIVTVHGKTLEAVVINHPNGSITVSAEDGYWYCFRAGDDLPDFIRPIGSPAS